MTWIADLAPCTYVPHAERTRAIGWLEPGHPYDEGAVDPGLLEELRLLVEDCWAPLVWCGYHTCGLCPPPEEGSTERPPRTDHELLLPGDGCVYVAPGLVAHYVEAHGYAPPREFQEAVHACPPMGSGEYFERLEAVGAEWLCELVEEDRRHRAEREEARKRAPRSTVVFFRGVSPDELHETLAAMGAQPWQNVREGRRLYIDLDGTRLLDLQVVEDFREYLELVPGSVVEELRPVVGETDGSLVALYVKRRPDAEQDARAFLQELLCRHDGTPHDCSEEARFLMWAVPRRSRD